ncbi:hypothetical protein CEXT_312091 [Caerostris extrusa]|uniref:Uncharacterized protein n=1 Tax=Caerostris extrusa TaxID=172846 RepID=A0AAV4QA02_CAEEX|nr:hypothetical protein CEXT_312091 [Caerostris extrusa]
MANQGDRGQELLPRAMLLLLWGTPLNPVCHKESPISLLRCFHFANISGDSQSESRRLLPCCLMAFCSFLTEKEVWIGTCSRFLSDWKEGFKQEVVSCLYFIKIFEGGKILFNISIKLQ